MRLMLEFDKATTNRRRGDPYWLLAAVLLSTMLAGCGGQPMPFPAPESELGPRPGLLTGDTGAWDALSALPSRSQSNPTGTPK